MVWILGLDILSHPQYIQHKNVLFAYLKCYRDWPGDKEYKGHVQCPSFSLQSDTEWCETLKTEAQWQRCYGRHWDLRTRPDHRGRVWCFLQERVAPRMDGKSLSVAFLALFYSPLIKNQDFQHPDQASWQIRRPRGDLLGLKLQTSV